LGGAQGQAADIEIQANEILRMRDLINNILKRHTKMSDEQIRLSTDRDFYMTPERAVELGVIDAVMNPPTKDAVRTNGAKALA
jgi:ATP-dependent Clp protease protease subunit